MSRLFYFRHHTDERSDSKIQELIKRHGIVAYGVYWCIQEALYESNTNTMSVNDDAAGSMAKYMKMSRRRLVRIMNDMMSLGLVKGSFELLSSFRVDREVLAVQMSVERKLEKKTRRAG